MSTTRKRKVLSSEQKLEVCRLVERGESLRKIAESFGVGLFTVSDIYRSRRQLTDFVSHMDTSSSCSSRKLMKKTSNSALDSAIYMWFLQKRALDEPIQEKALAFSTKLGIDNFVVSSGWLRNLKSWHGIRELKIHGEKLSADSERAEKFKCTLNDLINKERYSLDFVYNADETGLIWKCLPNTSLVSMTEKTANGFKSSTAQQKDEDIDMSDKPDEGTSHSEAYSCANILFNWMEQQKEFSTTQLMLMRHIRAISLHRRSDLRSNRSYY
ncbi:Jerky -like protein-like [Trichinella spiralis]|uniref:Jerky-like protein-like n=1 Tax=Trichinella spiralis TaxID=6334 RepID=A0A0V1BQ05_TRISP|nr:Jerky -like protein-like [Trichinella spiralis]